MRRLLDSEGDADAPAASLTTCLAFLVEIVVRKPAAGRSQGGEVGAGTRATHPSDRRTSRAASCVDAGDGREGGSCECVCLRAELGSGRTKEGNAPEGTKEGMYSLSDEESVRFLTKNVFAF